MATRWMRSHCRRRTPSAEHTHTSPGGEPPEASAGPIPIGARFDNGRRESNLWHLAIGQDESRRACSLSSAALGIGLNGRRRRIESGGIVMTTTINIWAISARHVDRAAELRHSGNLCRRCSGASPSPASSRSLSSDAGGGCSGEIRNPFEGLRETGGARRELGLHLRAGRSIWAVRAGGRGRMLRAAAVITISNLMLSRARARDVSGWRGAAESLGGRSGIVWAAAAGLSSGLGRRGCGRARALRGGRIWRRRRDRISPRRRDGPGIDLAPGGGANQPMKSIRRRRDAILRSLSPEGAAC
jgi:hypothetical protein